MTVRARLFALSATSLFVELALIRWLGSEVRVFAYFKNLILIACFLGFGLGFFRARAHARLGASLAVLVAVVVAVSWAQRSEWPYGPQVASQALSNFAGSVFMGDQTEAPRTLLALVAGLGWTLTLFMACIAVLFGFAQRIGDDIVTFGPSRQIAAYSWNVVGSLVGILCFAGVSRFALPPLYWFALPALATTPFLSGRLGRGLGVAGTAVLVWALWPRADAIWSPYHKLERIEWSGAYQTISVNGTGYMSLRSFAHAKDEREAQGVDRWRLPYTIHPGARRVLIIGAGAGNDAAAALRAGAERIVAVEIDPEIVRLGKRFHPDAPYDDARVAVVIDDARHYAETTAERFDLVVFSHLDSHTALSGYTNVRLDNYVHTVESFRAFRRRLAPGGALYVSFYATQRWVADRLHENLRLAFGRPPAAFYESRHPRETQAHFIASDSPELMSRAVAVAAPHYAQPVIHRPPRASTDDWPYLFVERARIPAPMLILAGLLAAVCLLLVGGLIREERREAGAPWTLDRHFFFLGAGFLLLEVHNVGRLARVFGTTWLVNAWVIAGILLTILLANALVARRVRLPGPTVTLALLLGSLIFAAFAPIARMIALPLGSLWICLLYSLPLLGAGLIFARSFAVVEAPARALGANILGALCGGFLELSSFVLGLRGLLAVAALLYLASYRRAPAAQREARKTIHSA
jgi:spermidine synthase